MRSGVRLAGVSDPLPFPQAAEGPTMKARSSLLCVAVASLVIAAVPSHAQSPAAPAAPVIPPGPQQIITPKIDTPTPTPAVIPTPDDLDVGLQISATLDGEPVDANPITMEPGQLLVLTLTGADLDKTPRNAAWTLNREAKGRIFHDSTQRCLSFTATAQQADSYLFTAAVNGLGEDARPDVVARWVVVSGKGPQPPPDDVDPPIPPKPDPVDPVKPTSLRVMILRDLSEEGSLPRPQLAALQSNDLEGWLTTVCSKDAEGTPLWRKWDDGYADDSVTDKGWLAIYKKAIADSNGKRPWIGIWDGERNTVSVEFPADEAAAKSLIQKHVP